MCLGFLFSLQVLASVMALGAVCMCDVCCQHLGDGFGFAQFETLCTAH